MGISSQNSLEATPEMKDLENINERNPKKVGVMAK